ncbi:hypothetical protein JST97_30155 [bacterium]|nr:hypothetical protein [bacterium]
MLDPFSRKLFLRAAILAGCAFAYGCSRKDERVTKIDEALQSGTGYLLTLQIPDGAWKSPRYPVFRDGYSLTPLVCLALQAGHGPTKALDKGADFMLAMSKEASEKLIFPVYCLSMTLVAFAQRSEANWKSKREEILSYLRKHQLNEDLGWQAEDLTYGGWGESVKPYEKPPAGRAIEENRAPNLSNTMFALEALRAAGVQDGDPAYVAGLKFLERCQNFGEGKDGGFFFSPTHRKQNKAGEFHSYGSTTADGLRALLAAGAKLDDPRVKAARKWLLTHFSAEMNPGDFPKERRRWCDGLLYYWGWSASQALRKSTPPGDPRGPLWAIELADSVLRRQKSDGTWSNKEALLLEDDPLVATFMAIGTLALCKAAIVGA